MVGEVDSAVALSLANSEDFQSGKQLRLRHKAHFLHGGIKELVIHGISNSSAVRLKKKKSYQE